MENTIFRPRIAFIRSFFSPVYSNPASRPSDPAPRPAPPTDLYAVICVTEVRVYGYGLSPQSAIFDAARHLPDTGLEDVPIYPDMTPEGLSLARCTPGFALMVERRGGLTELPFLVDSEGRLDYPPADTVAPDLMQRFDESLALLNQQIADFDRGRADPDPEPGEIEHDLAADAARRHAERS